MIRYDGNQVAIVGGQKKEWGLRNIHKKSKQRSAAKRQWSLAKRAIELDIVRSITVPPSNHCNP